MCAWRKSLISHDHNRVISFVISSDGTTFTTLKDVCKRSQTLKKEREGNLKDNEETNLAGAIDPAALARRDYQRII